MKRYYKESEICEMYGISHNTARKYFGYAIYRIGRCIRYDLWAIKAKEGGNNEQSS